MKKSITFILTVATLFSAFAFDIFKDIGHLPFTDIKETAWYYDSISRAYQNNLVFGTSETQFRPNDLLTREQAAMIFYNWSGADEKYDSCSFIDVKTGSWYCNAVEWAYRNEIMLGVGKGRFGVGDYITRQDLVTVIYRAYQKDTDREYGYLDSNFYKFTDHNVTSEYAIEAMKFATGLVQCILSDGTGGPEQPFLFGDNNNMLRPKAPCTRAEAVVIIIGTNRQLLLPKPYNKNEISPKV